jgi:hypothetical protein
MKSQITRLAVVGLLALTLVASAVQAATPPRNPVRTLPRAESVDFVAAVRTWLLHFFASHPFPSNLGQPTVQPKDGSQIDPNGGGQH